MIILSPSQFSHDCNLRFSLKVFEKIRENFKYANSSGVDQQVWNCFDKVIEFNKILNIKC